MRRITLAHGNGGRLMRALIEEVFAKALGPLAPDARLDAAELAWAPERLMVSTDGLTVRPLIFPGGSIGHLAVHSAVNDLAVAGGRARFLTLAAILEEGLELGVLAQVMTDFAQLRRPVG